MRFAVIIIHYHTPGLLAMAVESLLADIAATKLDAELLVIDNGSSKEGRMLMETLPVRLFSPGSNLGYAGGVNLGARNTAADILVFMNPDVMVFPGCLSALGRVLQGEASAAGPRFYWDLGKRLILPSPEKRDRREETAKRLAGRSEMWERIVRARWRRRARRQWLADSPLISYELSGALLAVRQDAWEEVGPFDEGFKLYFEETDWLMRLKRKRLKAAYVPEAEAAHFYNQSAAGEPSAARWFAESAVRFGQRYYGKWFCHLLDQIQPAQEPVEAPTPLLADGLPEINMDFSGRQFRPPLWVEISPSPLFFPAAAQVIGNSGTVRWSLPEAAWEYMPPGTYYLQIVDHRGIEISRFRFQRPAK